jgi:hypothetical protein
MSSSGPEVVHKEPTTTKLVMCHAVQLQTIACSPFRHAVALSTVATTIDLPARYLRNED